MTSEDAAEPILSIFPGRSILCKSQGSVIKMSLEIFLQVLGRGIAVGGLISHTTQHDRTQPR